MEELTSTSWARTCGPNQGDPYRIENWYSIFEDLTFKTITLPLKLEEAKSLKKFKETMQHLMMWEGRKNAEINPQHVIGQDWNANYFDEIEKKVTLSSSESAHLRSLEERLDQAIKQFTETEGGGGTFVKLSTRSPKDAGIWTRRMVDVMSEQIRQLQEQSKKKSYPNQDKINDVIAYTRAASYTLRVFNGKEALQLLLRSKRVLTDICFAELMGGEKFDLQIVVRQWSPEVIPEWEFRVFIWNQRITACSQYYTECFVPEISANQQKIKSLINQFYETQIKHRIPKDVENLTLDVVVMPSLSRVIMIELGNPPPVAGTALYDWKNENDKKIITNQQQGTFDFRVLNSFSEERWRSLHRVAKEIICKERGITMGAFSKTTVSSLWWSLTAVTITVVFVAVVVSVSYRYIG